MKSQFVKINALQGKSNPPEQSPSPNEWSTADTRPDVTFDHVQGRQPPSGQTRRRPGTGLLSNWKAGGLQPPSHNGIASPLPVTELDTLKQQSVNGTATAPVRNGNYVQMLAYGQLPVSPYQSAIAPLADLHASSQTRHPPQVVPTQGMQPFRPVISPNPSSQPLMAPRSMPVLAPAPPAPMSYPAQGYPAPFGRPPGDGKQGKKRKKRRVPTWARVVISLVLLLLLAAGGLGGYYYFVFSAPVSHIVNQQVARLKGDEDPNASRNGADILSGPRVNILLLGSDTDQKFSNGSYLAQTDIIITIDPATRQVGMLSIPRDFWIDVPGSGMHKLDEAYSLGGTALSRLTIYQDFGIPINYYAWVGLDGFIKVIDTVGGVDVNVLHPITDDNYPDDVGNNTGDIYAYKRLYIPAGPQHLAGGDALEYVRSRHADLVGDFGRSARQQQILSALQKKLTNPGIIGKLPDIAHDLDGYVKTDMQLTDVFKLVYFARGLNSSSINRVILGPPYSSSGTVGTKSVVFPDCAKITPVIAQMFALGNNARCDIQANSSGSSLASASQPSPAPITDSAWQMASQAASTGAMSLAQGGDNLFGFHSLLDLMLMVVFESPQAVQA